MSILTCTVDIHAPCISKEWDSLLDSPPPLEPSESRHSSFCSNKALHLIKLHEERTGSISSYVMSMGFDRVELKLIHYLKKFFKCHVLLPPSCADPGLASVQQEV
mmetsp:Transcript_19626/g.46381  ORF Transcript_19626/g.46381 Transcript_19626/m.46381 type:complete len:105 (+) Transcript_19626:40-354(+)